MKEKAIQFYRKGYNCVVCILKAAECQYGIEIPNKMEQGCKVLNNGFGVGGMCGVLIVGVMVFGMLFEEQKAKEMRLKLLSRFHEHHKSLHCSVLSSENNSCEHIIIEVCDLMDQIIKER